MSGKMLSLKERLSARRQDVISRLQGLETEWLKLTEPEVEWEEEAQKALLTRPFRQLTEWAREEIEEIDLALTKMATGRYGLCERCKKPVSLKRLEVLPATRFCQRCAKACSGSLAAHEFAV